VSGEGEESRRALDAFCCSSRICWGVSCGFADVDLREEEDCEGGGFSEDFSLAKDEVDFDEDHFDFGFVDD